MSARAAVPGRLRAAAIALALSAIPVCAGAQTVTAAALKAAFLLNFAQFIEWSADVVPAGAPVALCVVGDVPVADALDATVKGRSVDGHELTVHRLKQDAPVRACHVLYLSDSVDGKPFADVLEAVKGASIFTVSDRARFASDGGMVELFLDAGRMRFAVNVDALQRSRVRLSSRVLGLAKIVRDPDVQ